MPVSKKIEGMVAGSSLIRRMFEEGTRLKAEYGAENVFDFSLGNPNLEPPEAFRAALRDLISDPWPGMHGYMPNAGFPKVRDALAAHISLEQQVEVPADNIIMTVGAGGALNVVLKAVLDPGDEVVVPKPCFVEYHTYVDNHGGLFRPVRCLPNFDLNPSAIDAAITSRTRVVLINSPNNPTGRVYDRQLLESIDALIRRKSKEFGRTIYLLSDEPYRKIVYGNREVPPVLALFPNSIVVSSYSKDLSLAGERIGYIAVSPRIPGVDQLMAGLTVANRCLGFVNAPALMQLAVARCQEACVDIRVYERNRDLLYRSLVASGFEVPRPDGAFYLFPKAPYDDDVAFTAEMAEKRVLVVPGSGFGGSGHFRIAYCVPTETVERSLDIFREVGKKYFG